MDYILAQDVIDEAKRTDLCGLNDKVVARLEKKDYVKALELCSEAKQRCFEKTRCAGIKPSEMQRHSDNLHQITNLEGLIERLVNK